MTHLQSLAHAGRTVIVVIHSPSSRLLELLDDLLLLSGGRCFYNGTLEDLLPTLSAIGLQCPQYYNRADFGEICFLSKKYFSTLICKDIILGWKVFTVWKPINIYLPTLETEQILLFYMLYYLHDLTVTPGICGTNMNFHRYGKRI